MFLENSNISEKEIEIIKSVCESGVVSTAGEYVGHFETALARHLNVQDSLATNSGTSALHLALLNAGIGEGDEVLIPALTFIATLNAVLYVRAWPVLVDVDIDTWTMDTGGIDDKFAAVIPVHLYGNPCDMDKIAANYHYNHIIEDAAQSLGAKWNGIPTGTMGDYGCFSFNGNKVITTGSGGAVVSKKPLDFMRTLANQGRNKDGDPAAVGFNYKMSNISAAMGLAQMERLEVFLTRKKRYNEIYREELGDLIKFQQEQPGGESSYWFTAGTLDDGINVEDFCQKVRSQGVPIRRVFGALESYDFPVARHIADQGICLPSSTVNNEFHIEEVCKIVKKVLKK